MKPDEFERHLQDQPLRPVPAEWRDEILHQALPAAGRRRAAFNPRSAFWWRTWLWPSPTAWAGLAAAWVGILALNHAGSWEPLAVQGRVARTAHGPGFAFAEHRRYLSELLNEPEVESAPPVPPDRTSPRSALTLTNRLA
jgi:hypothetical protein